ncbi:MAG: peptide deformylase [Paraglaciecola sp.]
MEIAQIGESILKTTARKVNVQEFIEPEFKQFVQALLDSMLAAKGIGIAAPQVFDPRAIMIIASRANVRYPDAPEMEPLVLVNPKILGQSEHLVWHWEGCLSVPGLRGRIERPDWAEVQFQSITGAQQKIRFEGFLARIFLHEYDHLIGRTWLDHIESTDNVMAEAVWLKKVAKAV